MSTHITPINTHIPQQYPFIGQTANTINQIVKDVKLSLDIKQLAYVYLKNLSIRQGRIQFSLILKDVQIPQKNHFTILQYKGSVSQWININQPVCYGFIHLAQLASDVQMFFPGEFQLHKKTYYIQPPFEGIKYLYAQDSNLYIADTLNILFTGDIRCTKTIQDGISIVHVQSTVKAAQEYVSLQLPQNTFIYSINNKNCQNLNIQSASPAIEISGPFKAAQDVYVLQLSTDKTFPTCERQAMEEI